MALNALIDSPGELTGANHPAGPIVLSSRIRLARNLARFPFPGWAKEAQRREVLRLCQAALLEAPAMKRGTSFAIDQVAETDRLILVERHLISRELMAAKRDAGAVISRDQSISVMINEEDHLRQQFMRTGFKLKGLWKTASAFDTALEDFLDFAYVPELGYLTACPTNVGTGLRASVMMHLPGLVLAGHMDKVVRAVNQFGHAVRGLFGEDSEASGQIFQISNQQTLGETEEAIINGLTVFLQTIIEQEHNARHKLLENEPFKLFDKIGRAFGLSRHSHVVSSTEAMNQLSLLRLAVDLHILPEENRTLIDRMLIETQPGHVQHHARGRMEANRRDVVRASYLREQLAQLPNPNFAEAEPGGSLPA